MKNLRAAARMAAGIAAVPLIIGLTVMQAAFVGPVLRNRTLIPTLLYKMAGKLVGLKYEFNAASAPIVKDKPAWYIANHMSTADFLPLGSKFDGSFVGKGELLKLPVVSQIARALKYIGVRRSREYNGQSRAKIINNFNGGENTIMFPEGTTTDGSRVALFRAAMLKILYGEKGEDKEGNTVELEKDVVVQPIAITVKSIGGKPVGKDTEFREQYCLNREGNMLKRIWKRMQHKETVLELTVLPALDPKDFDNEMDLANQAARNIADIVNPGQEGFEKADIPYQATPQKQKKSKKKKKTEKPQKKAAGVTPA